MVELRTVPLPHEVDYFLDGASEQFEIDQCTYSVLKLYGDGAAMAPIVNYDRGRNVGPRGQHLRRDACRQLSDMATDILLQLPEERAGKLIYTGIVGLPYAVRELAKVLSDWAITDICEGGCLKPWIPREKRLVQPHRRDHRRLRSPKWIRRFVRLDNAANDLRTVAHRSIARLSFVDQDYVVYGGDEICRDLNTVNRLQPELVPGSEAYTEDMRETLKVMMKPEYRRKMMAERKKRRRIIKRAAVMASAILGASTVGALAQSKTIRIEGDTVALQISRYGSLAHVGHGGLSVDLTTRDGVKLADLCVYVDGTPALDQVTAFALFMQSGLESEVVKAANVVLTTPEGSDHPALAGRIKPRLQADDNLVLEQIQRAHARGEYWDEFSHERRRQRYDAYYAETEKLWISALGVFVLGSHSWMFPKGG